MTCLEPYEKAMEKSCVHRVRSAPRDALESWKVYPELSQVFSIISCAAQVFLLFASTPSISGSSIKNCNAEPHFPVIRRIFLSDVAPFRPSADSPLANAALHKKHHWPIAEVRCRGSSSTHQSIFFSDPLHLSFTAKVSVFFDARL